MFHYSPCILGISAALFFLHHLSCICFRYLSPLFIPYPGSHLIFISDPYLDYTILSLCFLPPISIQTFNVDYFKQVSFSPLNYFLMVMLPWLLSPSILMLVSSASFLSNVSRDIYPLLLFFEDAYSSCIYFTD